MPPIALLSPVPQRVLLCFPRIHRLSTHSCSEASFSLRSCSDYTRLEHLQAQLHPLQGSLEKHTHKKKTQNQIKQQQQKTQLYNKCKSIFLIIFKSYNLKICNIEIEDLRYLSYWQKFLDLYAQV